MDTTPNLDRDQVFTVKIFFISPINLISVVIDALTRLEFEAYTVDKRNKDKLLKLLSANIRNVIFVCIINELEAAPWIEYIDKLLKTENTFIQVGAFVHTTITQKTADMFLSRNVSVIRFSELVDNTLEVMKKILTYFEAKGTRSHIRAKSLGGTEAFFSIKSLNEPVKGTIVDISVDAFSCEIDSAFKPHFAKDVVHDKILLVLRGIRVRVAARVIGFSKENSNLFIFKFVHPQMINDQMNLKNELNKEEQEKIFAYIRQYLKDSIEAELDKISENK
jgi:hypothetical protein